MGRSGTGVTAALWGVVATGAVLGCGTPSRRLSTRAVDDPMTLPHRLMRVDIGASAVRGSQRLETPVLQIDYGLTDRLQLVNLSGLKYALWDDAPSPDASHSRDPEGAVKRALPGVSTDAPDGSFAWSPRTLAAHPDQSQDRQAQQGPQRQAAHHLLLFDRHGHRTRASW